MMGSATAERTGPGWRAMNAMLPRDHLLRRVDRLLDLGGLRAMLASHYSPRGRPSVDPELLIRMALIGRLYAVRSERRLCEEVRYNLSYRWFCGLAPGAAVPHHSTFSKNRHGRFRDAGVFRLLFEATVRRCITAGLVTAKDAAIDASFVAADASWQRKMRDGDLESSCLARPVREWLADQACAPVQEQGRPRGRPAEVSRTDPASAWSARTARGRFGYALNVLVDMPRGVVMDVEASPARFASEADAGRVLLARADERFGYRPKRVAADTAYGSAAFLAFVHARGSVPYIPVLERSEQTKGMFPRAAFAFDSERDRYICPTGRVLKHRGFDRQLLIHVYGARPADCRVCPLKPGCTSGPSRNVTRMADEATRDLARAEMGTGLFKRSMRLRRGVERLFADAKARRGLGRLHLRGLRGAEEEFQLAAAVLNLLLLARSVGKVRRWRGAPALPDRLGRMAKTSLACLASAASIPAARPACR